MNGQSRINWTPVIIVWIIVVAIFAARTVLQYHDLPLIAGGDDTQRIVTAKDLLNGQNWFDLVEHRDDAPYGSLMHWSRLIDAPLAGMMAVFRPMFGLPIAADIAATIWPLLLLLPLMMLETAIGRRLMPEADLLPAAILPVISLALLDEFRPGRVDHHNVQILLCLVALYVLIAARDKWRWMAVAGFAYATSLAIGLETVPFVAVAIVLASLLWVAAPQRYAASLMGFSGALGLGSVAHFFAATAPQRYLELSCDMLGAPYLLILGTSSLAMLLAALFASRLANPLVRLAIIGGLGMAGAGLWVAVYPQCLHGPYVFVDPIILEAMFVHIGEAQSVLNAFQLDPVFAIAVAAPALLMLPLTAWLAYKATGERRIDWLVVLAFLIVADAILLTQMRGAKFATAFAIPAGIYLITLARSVYLRRQTFLSGLGLLASWIIFAGGAQTVLIGGSLSMVLQRQNAPATLAIEAIRGAECVKPPYLDRLATLPTGTVMAPIRLGPLILHLTSHSVVSAGFHRNNDGTLDALKFYPGTDAERLAIIAKRNIAYVVSCGTELQGAYLEPLSPPTESLHIYRVRTP